MEKSELNLQYFIKILICFSCFSFFIFKDFAFFETAYGQILPFTFFKTWQPWYWRFRSTSLSVKVVIGVSFDDTGFLYPGFATERDFCSVPFWSPKTIQDNEHSCSVPFYSKRNGKYIVIPRWTNITPFILLKQDIPFLNSVYS